MRIAKTLFSFLGKEGVKTAPRNAVGKLDRNRNRSRNRNRNRNAVTARKNRTIFCFSNKY